MTGDLEFHPLANLFPLIEGEEFDALVADIRANGLRDRIILYGGKILDGRNRYRACLEADVEPKAVVWAPPRDYDDPLAYVVSRNLHRRHLTTQQRAAIAAELATMKSGARTDLASNDARSAMSDAQAAETLKVSESSVERAKKRMREDPEAHAKAKAGKLARKKPVPRREQKRQRAKEALAEMKAQVEAAATVELPVEPVEPVELAEAAIAAEAMLDVVRWMQEAPVATVADMLLRNIERGRLIKIWNLVILTHTGKRSQPAPATPPPAPASPRAVREPAEIATLRSWAIAQPFDELLKRAASARVTESGLRAFLSGNLGSYHLHRALEAVRDDLTGDEAAP
jgi:ParB-like chromosome segregation protein Spo0J